MIAATTSIPAALALLAACTPVIELSSHFDERDYQWAAATGTARITGQAFAKTLGGEVKYCAGEPVSLWPRGRYTDKAYDALVKGVYVRDAPPAELQKYIRTTTADGFGSFEFVDLPAGSFYAVCNVRWMYGSGIYAQQTGGVAIAPVTVAAGMTQRVVVTLPRR